MPKINQIKSVQQIENLIELTFEQFKNDENEIIDFFKEEEIDIEKLENRNKDFISKLQVRLRINEGKQKESIKRNIFIEAIEMFKQYGEGVKEVLSKNEYEHLSVQFRNAEDISDGEIEELLKDKALIKLMEKIHDRKNKK